MELIFLGWLAAAIGAGAIASSKGRSGLGYFVLGLVFPLIGLLIAMGMSPLADEAPRAPGDLIVCPRCGRPHRMDAAACPKCGRLNIPAAPPATKKCPACAETILAEARKCKHCGEPQVDAAAGLAS